MGKLTLLENKITKEQSSAEIIPPLSWKDSPPAQRLLDVICSILAEEYISIAKQNPEIFQNQGVKK